MSEPAPSPGAEPDRPVILIVEDEVLVRMLIADILQEDGFKVIEAKDATEALRVLEAQPGFHVLLTDAEMPPGPDGFELARHVCERWPDIQVLISSGRMRPSPDDMPACTVFLPKPWTAQSLVRHVQEAADRAMGKK